MNRISVVPWFLIAFLSPSRAQTCSCSYQTEPRPSVVIDCSRSGLLKFPLNGTGSGPEFCKFEGAHVELDLSRNEISRVSIPPFPKGLARIDLSFNEITDVKYVDVKEARVRELDLSNNRKLERMTGDLESETLRVLVAKNCSIKRVEEKFFENVPSLDRVDLSFNMLEEVSRFRGSGSGSGDRNGTGNSSGGFRLAFLNVSHNNIRDIRGKELLGIRILDVSGNKMEHFKFTVYLGHLEELYVSDNALEGFEGMTLPKASLLDASKNKLRHVEIDFTAKAPKLKKLNLSRNSLGKISKIKSCSLSDLDLSYCRINYIETEAFSMLVDLKRLDLTGNRLSSVHPGTFLASEDLQFLYLGENPWRCDCESSEFQALYRFVLVENSFSEGEELGCEGSEGSEGSHPVPTWKNVCKETWRGDNDLIISRRTSFYALLYIFASLLIVVTGFLCFKFIRNTRQSDVFYFVGESQRVPPRDSMEEAAIPPERCRRSTPPPDYEAALLLPVLTEEQRSTLSLDKLNV